MRPEEGFAMDWAADERGNKQVSAIAKALKGADRLWLATDPDREGEAISWHVQAMLEEKKALKGIDVQRITFNEITKSAVQHAMAHPRALDQPLIEAYLARRALDYLVGFTLSPVLWRKLPGSRSAGRVQSVALRLVCEREAEIEAFRAREFWTVEAHFTTPAGAPFTARLTHLDGKKLDQFDLNTEALAQSAKAAVEAGSFSVASVERRRVKRNPQPPFTTSSFQMDASRKLGMGAQAAMRIAQQLYEGVDIGGETVGLISYMRTDGVQMAREAIAAIRDHVGHAYGADYLPGAPREYSTKAKNAQEAHEAIRPTDVVAHAGRDDANYLNDDQRRVYDLIWKRAVASQMQSAELDQVAVDVASGGTKPARHRVDRGVRRLPEAVPRSDRRGAGGRQPRREPHAAADERAGPAAARQGGRRAALHPAAAALLRGQPGQAHGGAGDRPPLHLRLHYGDAAQPQLRPHGEPPAVPGGSRAAGDGVSSRPSSSATWIRASPPGWRTSWTRCPTAGWTGAR